MREVQHVQRPRSPNDVVVLGMIRSPTAADRKRRLGSDRGIII